MIKWPAWLCPLCVAPTVVYICMASSNMRRRERRRRCDCQTCPSLGWTLGSWQRNLHDMACMPAAVAVAKCVVMYLV